MFRGDFYSRFSQFLDFSAKMLDVDNHSETHYVDGVVSENTRRQQVKRKLTLIVDYGMSGVVSALITYDNVVLLRKKVNHSALSFVAPVDSYNRCKHIFSFLNVDFGFQA